MLEFVLTDIHGHRKQLLKALVECVKYATEVERDYRFIFLGDYIDRGPDSKGVIQTIRAIQEDKPNTIVLKGNHEEMMLDAWKLQGLIQSSTRRHREDFWLKEGGKETLANFNDVDYKKWPRPFLWKDVPGDMMAWMEKLPVLVATKHRAYVHAGLLPGTPIDEQIQEHCLWIRDKFLKAKPTEFKELNGLYIVHGHTPTWAGRQDAREPEILPHRCNLDAGTFFTGLLTVGVFDANIPGGPIDIIRIEGEPSVKVVILGKKK